VDCDQLERGVDRPLPARERGARGRGAEELIEVVQAYLK